MKKAIIMLQSISYRWWDLPHESYISLHSTTEQTLQLHFSYLLKPTDINHDANYKILYFSVLMTKNLLVKIIYWINKLPPQISLRKKIPFLLTYPRALDMCWMHQVETGTGILACLEFESAGGKIYVNVN